MTIWEFDAWLVEQARRMPRSMNKGGTSQAQQNMDTANAENTQLNQMGIQEEKQVLPFLQSEITNPQGFGQQGVNEMLTAGGQAASGATGAATEAANLRASRSGNPSSTASIIDAAARAGMQNQTNNANNINIQNLQEKQKQQQAGASGLAGLSQSNIGEGLSALGLSNQALEQYVKAYANTDWQADLGAIGGLIGGIGGGVGAAATGISKL